MEEANSKINSVNDQINLNKLTDEQESINAGLNLDNKLNNEAKNLVNGHLNSQQINDKMNLKINLENSQSINELTNTVEQKRLNEDDNNFLNDDNSDYKSLNESSIEDTNDVKNESSKIENLIEIKDQISNQTSDNQIPLDNESLNKSVIEINQQLNESIENNQLLNQSNNDSIIEVSTNEQSLNQTVSSVEEITINESSNQIELNESSNQIESNEFKMLFDNPDLLKRLISKGDEKILKPERGCEVVINLEVRNHETSELIESESQNNLKVFIGDFDLLHGVDLALMTMHKNEIAEILIKSKLAYGASGKQPDIPGDCSLICKVELLKITWPNEICCASLEDLSNYFDISKRKKERGNFYFKRNDFEIALHCYNRAGEILDFLGQEMLNRHHMLTECKEKAIEQTRKDEIQTEINLINDLSAEFMKIKFDIFNNLSAVLIKLKLYNQAFDTINNALSIKPTNVKALYRKSKILTHKGSIEEAINCLKEATKLEPKNKIFINDLTKLKVRLNKDIKKEKELYAKMLQPELKKNKKLSNQKQKSSNKFNYLTAGVIVGGIALSTFLIYKKFANN